MTGPSVQIGVNWAEEGAQIPTQAASKLDQLGAAAQRLEVREPTMALREMRGAMDELAVSASGLSGPEGSLIRLAATLGDFGVGLPAMAAAIGGFVAVGEVIKTLNGLTKDLNDTLDTTQQALASGIPSAVDRLRAKKIQDRLTELEETRAARISSIEATVVGPQGGLSPTEAAAYFGQTAEGVAVNAEIDNLTRANTAIQRDAAKRRDDDAARARLARQRAGERATRVTQRPITMEEFAFQDFMTPNLAPSSRVTERPITMDEFAMSDFMSGFVPPEDTEGTVGLKRRPFEESGGIDAVRGQNVDFRRIAAAGVGAAGAVRRGGVGDILGAAGGVASAVPGGQVVGAGLEGAGGLFKLFTSGEHKITIHDIEQQALDKINQTRGVPTQSGFTVVGGDARTAQYLINRQAAMGVTPRGV